MNKQAAPVHFLGDEPHDGYKPKSVVTDCIQWLKDQGLNQRADLDYCPSRGITFEVLCPLKDCRDGKRRVFPIGKWERVGRTDPGASAIHATFRNVETGERMFICVGYEPWGGHSIMAWKDNIRLVPPTS